MSTSPRDSQRPQRPKSAAQRASDANKIQQHAVRTNTSRPGDRRTDDTQHQADHKSGASEAKR